MHLAASCALAQDCTPVVSEKAVACSEKCDGSHAFGVGGLFMAPPHAQKLINWAGTECPPNLPTHTVDVKCEDVPVCPITCAHYTAQRRDAGAPQPTSWANFGAEPQTGCVSECDAAFTTASGAIGCFSKFGLAPAHATDVFHLRAHAGPVDSHGQSYDCSLAATQDCTYDSCKLGHCTPRVNSK